MNRCKVFKIFEEVTAYLFSEEIEADIISMPSDVDDLTDEEQFDYDNLGTPVASNVARTLEIIVPDENESCIISEIKSKSNSRKRKREILVEWTNETPKYAIETLKNSSKIKSNILIAETSNMSPAELFEEFFTEIVYDLFVEETNRYAH